MPLRPVRPDMGRFVEAIRPSVEASEPIDRRTVDLDLLSRRYGVPAAMLSEHLLTRFGGELVNRRPKKRRVDGRIVLPTGEVARNVELVISARPVGGEFKEVARATTDEEGLYSAVYGKVSVGASLLVSVADEEEPIMHPIASADVHETLNLVVPADAVAPATESEFERIGAALEGAIGDASIGDLEETAARRDLSLLASSTNIDARLIAMNVAADQLSGTGVESAALFGVSRLTGLTTLDGIAGLPVQGMENLIGTAIECNLIPSGIDAVAQGAAIGALVSNHRLEKVPVGAVSSVREIFMNAGFDGETAVSAVTALYSESAQVDGVWAALEGAGTSAAQIESLARELELGHFTSHNSALNSAIAAGLSGSVLGLVDGGYFEPDKWQDQIVGVTPPGGFDGDYGLFQAEQAGFPTVDAYAQHMATEVRSRFPTQVMAKQIRDARGQPDNPLSSISERALSFLESDEGFDFRTAAVDGFFARTGRSPDPSSQADIEEINELRMLQRVFQITPNSAAMQVLLAEGLTSAASVVGYTEQDFLARFGPSDSDDSQAAFDSVEVARFVHQKAEQVCQTAQLLSVELQTMGSSPEVTVLDRPEPALIENLRKFPAIESLMGSIDFCECDHCGSVLSPAAYLVDVLQFLRNGSPERSDDTVPFFFLNQRRPDIARLPLTCANTNTELPYIDLVNEIMEHTVSFRSENPGEDIPGDLVSSVPLDTTADPVVEPLDGDPAVADAAYETLRGAPYPSELPFNLPLATSRRFLSQFDASLADLLQLFADPTDAHDPQRLTGFHVRAEELNLSPEDVEILLDLEPAGPGGRPEWWELYGYATEAEALAGVAGEDGGVRNAKTLARRLGVTYRELIRLFDVRFVNPLLDPLRSVVRDGVPLASILRFLDDEVDNTERPQLDRELDQPTIDVLRSAVSAGTIDGAVLLFGLTADCDFGAVEIGTVNPAAWAATAGTLFRRLAHFVRLWRRLNWSVDELDAVLAVFADPGELDDRAALAEQLEKVIVGVSDIARYVSLAPQPLSYDEIAALFLGSDTERLPDVFLDRIASAPSLASLAPVRAKKALTDDEVPPARSALASLASVSGLTSTEVSLVLDALDVTDGQVVDLEVVLGVARAGILARSLGLPLVEVRELVDALVERTSQPSADDNVARVADPVAFASVVSRMRSAGLKPDDISRLSRYAAVDFDESGVLVALLTALEQARAEEADLVGPNITDTVISRKLALVVAASDAQQFMAWWTDGLPDFAEVLDSAAREQKVEAVRVQAKALLRDQLLFDPVTDELLDGLTDAANEDRRALMAARLLDLVRGRLRRQRSFDAVSDVLELEAELAHALLDVDRLEALAELGAIGFSGAPGELRGLFRADRTARFSFYLPSDAPGTDAINVYKAAVGPSEHLDAQPIDGGIAVELTGGELYGLELISDNPSVDHWSEIEWSTTERSREPLTASIFVPWASAQTALLEVRRVGQSVYLAEKLSLSAAELMHFSPTLSALPVEPSDAVPEDLTARLHAVLEYVDLRNSWVGDRGDLVDLLGREPAIARFAEIARVELQLGADATTAVGLAEDTQWSVGGLRDAKLLLDLMRITGLSVPEVESVAIDRESGGRHRLVADDSRRIRNAVRARYDASAWRNVAKPIFDDLRQMRRDALAAHLGHELAKTPEELFEWFLVDPGMEPVVLASRIQLALASIQLFVHRSLLNLETDVTPSMIRRDRWEWMRRYRVWEANRKIFLHPENWLEPEFRGQKSHLFRELEATLLADDIDDDRAEVALHDYLRGLESIARLEIMSTFWEEENAELGESTTDRTLHVIARTYSEPKSWYYRTRRHNRWSPWEPITADLEGDHVVVSVWQGRPHIFWLSIMERLEQTGSNNTGSLKPSEDPGADEDDQVLTIPTPAKAKTRYDARLNWVELTTDGWGDPTSSEQWQLDDPGDQIRVGDPLQAGMSIQLAEDGNIRIELRGRVRDTWESSGFGIPESSLLISGVAFELAGRFATPSRDKVATSSQRPPLGYLFLDPPARHRGDGPMTARYDSEPLENQQVGESTKRTREILGAGTAYQIVNPASPATVATATGTRSSDLGNLLKPLFYQDDKRTFLVSPSAFDLEPAASNDSPNVLDVQIPEQLIPIECLEWRPDTGPIFDDIATDPVAILPIVGRPIDAVINPGVAVQLGDAVLGEAGLVGEFVDGRFELAGGIVVDEPIAIKRPLGSRPVALRPLQENLGRFPGRDGGLLPVQPGGELGGGQ